MFNPVATYRIQFHKGFTFNDFERIVPYLVDLGVSTIYASPIFESTPGSTHGYDVVNPHQINPEIGTEEHLKSINKTLKEKGIKWIQDIVPNHMAYHPNNRWLMDVLEKGKQSVFSDFFDIYWNDPLMVPFLGDSLEGVIEKGELKISFEDQRFKFKYYDNYYPLNLRSYERILKSGHEERNEALQQILGQLQDIHQIEDPKSYSSEWEELCLQLSSLIKNESFKKYIESCLEEVNNSKVVLKEIAEEQAYRLCRWQETDKRINYRRFFTVNSLICLNIHNKEVFNHYHSYLKTLLDDGIFTGLRVDHIDGLYDPTSYLEDLRELAGEETYIVVEKILEPKEELPTIWPIQGNTGYDFLSIANNLFTNKVSSEKFTRFYEKIAGERARVQDQIYDKKTYILSNHMNGELENLYQLFLISNLAAKDTLASIDPIYLKSVIGEFLVQCPVYRYYGNQLPLKDEEASEVRRILDRIRESRKELTPAVHLLENAFLQRPGKGDLEYNKKALHFYQRCMQFTGPLMAKGVEDTLMYTYNRFIGHNEVGDSPEAFGYSISEFHQQMVERQQNWSLTINATSTHDTKRGEDSRARLNVLTDLADEWIEVVDEWRKLNVDLKKANVPDQNDEYFIYQTLIGAFPFSCESQQELCSRLQEYLEKALREAKRHSNWVSPNIEYEEATKAFVKELLNLERPFWKSFQDFYKRIVDFGIINSLSQLLLKFTCPGVPDIYQGCELWDLSLVDPDNRRPVNYEQRIEGLQFLNKEENLSGLLQQLWENRTNAQLKLLLVNKLLHLRADSKKIFLEGEYIPLKTEGKYKENIAAFARKYKNEWFIVAVPLKLTEVWKAQKIEILSLDWEDTKIVLQAGSPIKLTDLISEREVKQDQGLFIKDIFKPLPFAILKGYSHERARGAGVLLSITSLPSDFGIGDFGPQAAAFVNFLHRTGQSYWQLLPLNPTDPGSANSPYSSYSSIAGNTLLISPELLMKEGFLKNEDLKKWSLPQNGKVDYKKASELKQELLEKAYQAFLEDNALRRHVEFEEFCENENSWLMDFALYVVLRMKHGGKAWNLWPDEYKLRNRDAINNFISANKEELKKIKWFQYIFFKQWKELKRYCNRKNIQLFGDLPFYISFDSVDVWSHSEIFSLDKEGSMAGIAGVPPDYFNEDGQLWGMPVFKWDVLKERGYDWWVQRLRKNLEMYDLVRLDHFRAFSAFWEVSANEKTARNGVWKEGPGSDFFNKIKIELGELPFVAEDLGDIDKPVYALRDEFELPGMKVLQFAFGEDMPKSLNSPHNYTENYIVYTGTHDNNTTVGWFKNASNEIAQQQLEQYSGVSANEKNVHEILSRIAYASVAKIAILPMQDVLGTDETTRMNTPASVENNWSWRLPTGAISSEQERLLGAWVKLFNRD